MYQGNSTLPVWLSHHKNTVYLPHVQPSPNLVQWFSQHPTLMPDEVGLFTEVHTKT